jgi:hypothetical protein
MIANAYISYQNTHRLGPMEFIGTIMLVAAFLSGVANQLCRDLRQAILFNNIAIALFVLDVFLVMVGWPGTHPGHGIMSNYP